MRRRDVLMGVSSAAAVSLWHTISQLHQDPKSVRVSVDWQTSIAKSTVNTFGSNDYEITTPERARDSAYQKLLSELNIKLIRIHHGELTDRWSNAATKTWEVMQTKSDRSSVEAMAVINADGGRSLLLINKSAKPAELTLTGMSDIKLPNILPIFYLNADGVQNTSITQQLLLGKAFNLGVYSLALVRLSR